MPALAVPVGQRPRRGLERPAAELDDQARFLGDRDELARRDRAVAVMLPAGQRLEAGDLAGLELDQRLIGERQLDRSRSRRRSSVSMLKRRRTASAWIGS